MTKEELVKNYCSDFFKVMSALSRYSDYEIGLLGNFTDDMDDLEESVLKEVQWDILESLISPFVDDFDSVFSEYEDTLGELCDELDLITYNRELGAYAISEGTIIDLVVGLLEDTKYHINIDVDFKEIIVNLNRNYPIKFCEE